MKLLILILTIVVSLSIWARNDIDLSSFNKEVSKNMQEVLDENPQIYEKGSPGRSPASITEEPDNKIRTEGLDNFDEQATGPNEL
ncbi:MAG: hypothetical protein CME65_07940 [Halobacteriovoraceae bacterium]|nr:hypothetical protein [Halobacteriovoraceae bacterium]|tara:strand:+ start:10454 stop:10708 length:255 start_codon:yes stop_codon:yes gene_type:complete